MITRIRIIANLRKNIKCLLIIIYKNYYYIIILIYKNALQEYNLVHI